MLVLADEALARGEPPRHAHGCVAPTASVEDFCTTVASFLGDRARNAASEGSSRRGPPPCWSPATSCTSPTIARPHRSPRRLPSIARSPRRASTRRPSGDLRPAPRPSRSRATHPHAAPVAREPPALVARAGYTSGANAAPPSSARARRARGLHRKSAMLAARCLPRSSRARATRTAAGPGAAPPPTRVPISSVGSIS